MRLLRGPLLLALPLLFRFRLQKSFLRHGKDHAECVAHSFGISIAGNVRPRVMVFMTYPFGSLRGTPLYM
jgi:hypothetical protein